MLWQTAAALNLPVFPCLADKRPACAHGFKDATTDKRKIRDIFLAHPNAALIGVPTGAYSGIDILDLDSAKHPVEVRQWISGNRALIPPTRAHRTQSGGVHYLFEHLDGLKTWGARPSVGIDGRADGGYAVWWPASGLAINDKPIMRWPTALVRQFIKPAAKPISERKAPKISEPRLERLARRVARSPEGQRNDLLFWAACRLAEWIARDEIPREVAEAALLIAARYAGLPDRESIATINSGLSPRSS